MKRKILVNEDIRETIKQAGLRHFEVFDELKIGQASWTRILCRPLSEEDRKLILEAVKRLTEGKVN